MTFSPDLWSTVGLTLRLAFVTTGVLLILGLPLAHWLNTSRWRGVAILETLVTLPIVLPPTVIGFYLLVTFSPNHWPGQLWQSLTGHSLAFSFAGLVVGSVIYSLPFAVQPFQSALKGVPESLVEAARVSGASGWQIFRHIAFPLARRGILTGVILSFAHTVGEFGVVLMLGGNIPGVTRVASISLYDEMQKLNYPAAHGYALVLLAIAFVTILILAGLQRRADGR